MQDYINLINFLKENDESVKKDLETLKFGTKVKYCTCWHNNIYEDWIYIDDKYVMSEFWEVLEYKNIWQDYLHSTEPDIKIIWNNLDYHHIMMYCYNKNIDLTIVECWEIYNTGNWQFITKLDNTKPFHEQKSEVYKALLDYFIWLQ